MPAFKLYGLLSLVSCIVIFAGCENNLKDVERISSQKVAILLDRSTNVEIIYSDSAVVKAKLITPVLLHYKGAQKPYYEMPKGVKVIFFDENHEEESNIVADYAISRETEKLVELRKNVVATNREGSTFKSDELFWDETKRRFYSNKTVTITSPNQTIYGTSFWANENFSYYEIKQSTGTLNVPEQETRTDSQVVAPAVQP